jgi:MoxR-like ATPase
VTTKSEQEKLEAVEASMRKVILTESNGIELVLIGILAGGHVLLEDVPGVGKTTLSKALARVLNMEFSRVQFTPDLLPSDILGTSVLNPKEGTFRFHEGPVFHNLLLADEINRASPRTQSALLEAMNEKQVSIDGKTRPLPAPFFVIATQNPVDYQGTYPLPEAQLDRFLLRVSLGYPSQEGELKMLFDRKTSDPLEELSPVLDVESLLSLQKAVKEVNVEKDVALYLYRLIEATRGRQELALGGSPRATLALFRASQARAFFFGREYVSPDDIQTLAVPVLAHRVMLSNQSRYGGQTTAQIIEAIVSELKVPT